MTTQAADITRSTHAGVGPDARALRVAKALRDLEQLTNFAGGNRYGQLLTPISDYTEMANRVTDDLNRIYDEITRLTGEDPLAVPPEGSNDPIQPRHC